MGEMLSIAGACGVLEVAACPLFGLFLIPHTINAFEVSKSLRLLMLICYRDWETTKQIGRAHV